MFQSHLKSWTLTRNFRLQSLWLTNRDQTAPYDPSAKHCERRPAKPLMPHALTKWEGTPLINQQHNPVINHQYFHDSRRRVNLPLVAGIVRGCRACRSPQWKECSSSTRNRHTLSLGRYKTPKIPPQTIRTLIRSRLQSEFAFFAGRILQTTHKEEK